MPDYISTEDQKPYLASFEEDATYNVCFVVKQYDQDKNELQTDIYYNPGFRGYVSPMNESTKYIRAEKRVEATGYRRQLEYDPSTGGAKDTGLLESTRGRIRHSSVTPFVEVVIPDTIFPIDTEFKFVWPTIMASPEFVDRRDAYDTAMKDYTNTNWIFGK